MTPRKSSWIALVVFFLAIPLAASLPLSAGVLVILLALVGYGIFQARLRCPRCGTLLVRRRLAGISVYVPLAPRSCANCGLDLGSLAGRAEVPASDDPGA